MSGDRRRNLREQDKWENELRAAGWKPRGVYVWEAPNGELFRGPYQAWLLMKSVEQSVAKPWGREM